jgi:hypothetical protein
MPQSTLGTRMPVRTSDDSELDEEDSVGVAKVDEDVYVELEVVERVVESPGVVLLSGPCEEVGTKDDSAAFEDIVGVIDD